MLLLTPGFMIGEHGNLDIKLMVGWLPVLLQKGPLSEKITLHDVVY